MTAKLAIVGGGIIGMSTAVLLKTRHPDLNITIYAEEVSPNTTGDGAAGLWTPFDLSDTPVKDVNKWAKATFDFLANLVKENAEHPKMGVYYQQLFCISETAGIQMPYFQDILLNLRLMSDQELQLFPDAKSGYSYTTLMCEGLKMIGYLSLRFAQLGGTVVRRRINSFDELHDSGYNMIVNCTGLGARNLCSDPAVQPIRGQIHRVQANWVKFVLCTDDYYIIPTSEYVVLGGTHQRGNWDLSISPDDKRNIFEGCCRLMPGLKNAVELSGWVGLRPGRTSVRVEVEPRCHAGSGQAYTVIHNYGHGGSGLTLFWGCALRVAELFDASQ